MKWYTFNDSGDLSSTINLILDHNTTAQVAWNSSNSNVNGPNEILTQLKADTDLWVGVPTRTDIYNVSNGIAKYTINYKSYKARLITALEIAKIAGDTNFDESTSSWESWYFLDSRTQSQTITTIGGSNYDYLFDYTSTCTNYGCNIADASNDGYWTATAAANSNNITWCVSKYGVLDNYFVNNSHSDGNNGVRPVITILKSNL